MSEPIDLTACDREPISIPGSVQPHGLMLVLRGNDLLVVQTSANSALFLNVEPEKLLGQPVGHWFDEKSVEALREASKQEALERQILCSSLGESSEAPISTGSFTDAAPICYWN
jgi:two-component system, chemotaxis family, sensor kinase Cph1